MLGTHLQRILTTFRVPPYEYIHDNLEKIIEFKDLIADELRSLTEEDISKINESASMRKAVVAISLIVEVEIELIEHLSNRLYWSISDVTDTYSNIFYRLSILLEDSSVDTLLRLKSLREMDLDDFLNANYEHLIENRTQILDAIENLSKQKLLTLKLYNRRGFIALLVVLGAPKSTVLAFIELFKCNLNEILVDSVLSGRSTMKAFMRFKNYVEDYIIDIQLDQNTEGSQVFYLSKNISDMTDVVSYTKKIFESEKLFNAYSTKESFFEKYLYAAFTFRRQLKYIVFTERDLMNEEVYWLLSNITRENVLEILEPLEFESFDIFLKCVVIWGPFEITTFKLNKISQPELLQILNAIDHSYNYQTSRNNPMSRTDLVHQVNKNVSGLMYSIFATDRMTREIVQNHWDKVSLFLWSDDLVKTMSILKGADFSLKEALDLMGR